MLDPVKVEAAEASIDRFIDQRSKQREESNALEAMWRASERRVLEKRREENRLAWAHYFEHLAHSCRQQAQRYDSKVEALLEEGTA